VKTVISSLFLFISITQGLFAEADPMGPPPDQSFTQTLVMIAIAFMFFYVILWRPEQKRRKALETQRNALKKGDRVAAMGIIGTVSRIEENTVILKMYDGTKLEFYKAAVTDILSDGTETVVDESSQQKGKND
jgi:preprotein translocase subunit YajC